MKLVLRAGLVAVVAAVAAQAGSAARVQLVTTPNSLVFWTPRDGLLGVGRCASTE